MSIEQQKNVHFSKEINKCCRLLENSEGRMGPVVSQRQLLTNILSLANQQLDAFTGTILVCFFPLAPSGFPEGNIAYCSAVMFCLQRLKRSRPASFCTQHAMLEAER
eukprot:1159936-Pelagomonas_calceolata.AAC.2